MFRAARLLLRNLTFLIAYSLISYISLTKLQIDRYLTTSTSSSSMSSIDCYPNANDSNYCYDQCRVKYKGQKNYYNSQTYKCEQVVTCDTTQVYNITTNTCSYENMSASNNYPPLNNSDYQLSTNSTNLIVGKTIICVNGMMINGTNICICDLGWTLDSKLVKLNPNATVIYDCTLYNDPKTNAGSSNNSQSNSNINSNSLNTTDANTLNAPNVNNTLQSNGNSQNSQSSTDNGNIRNNSTSSWILDSTAFSWGDLPNIYIVIIIVGGLSIILIISCVCYHRLKKKDAEASSSKSKKSSKYTSPKLPKTHIYKHNKHISKSPEISSFRPCLTQNYTDFVFGNNFKKLKVIDRKIKYQKTDYNNYNKAYENQQRRVNYSYESYHSDSVYYDEHGGSKYFNKTYDDINGDSVDSDNISYINPNISRKELRDPRHRNISRTPIIKISSDYLDDFNMMHGRMNIRPKKLKSGAHRIVNRKDYKENY